MKEKVTLNQNTISHFAKVWFRNYFVNLDLGFNRDHTGFIFSDSFPFEGKDILFVGAAPILEEQIEWIHRNKDRIYILSSDTACYPLIANGIRPDYILSIDAGRGTIYHFRNLPSDIPIITWLGANSHIFYLPNPIYIYFSTYPLDQVFHSTLFSGEENIIKNPSLNVAGLAKTLTEKFRANRLILSGISFKIQSAKTHCRGTGYEYYNLPKVNRFYPMESYIPNTYKNSISSKNQLALYHLTESKQLIVLHPENIFKIQTESAIYKTKPLSIKLDESNIKKFQKLLKNKTIQTEILKKTGINNSLYNKLI